MKPCEDCGARGALVTKGVFAGSHAGVDYCEFCSKDLCNDCMDKSRCAESADGKHHRPPEEE